MDNKRPIDVKRERGGSADIGSAEDGAIVEMYSIRTRLLIIKERAVYELRLADDIDPNRENPDFLNSRLPCISLFLPFCIFR